MVERLHYITQETKELSHIDCVEKACEAGVKWIQLRVKHCDEVEYMEVAHRAKRICDHFDAKLIINDNVAVAKKVKAYGVHLGKEDMNPVKARSILGKDSIIGATANTVEDIMKLVRLRVSYIGLGPYRFTKTKEKLSPVLGVEGYGLLPTEIKNQVPIIAVGGIQLDDVTNLLQAGIHGIAVSGCITQNFSVVSELQAKLNS